jgi:hypothetical protein
MKKLLPVLPLVTLSLLAAACQGEPAPAAVAAPQAPAQPAAAAVPEGPPLWCAPAKCACQDGEEIKEEPGSFQSCKLAADTVIQGIKVKGGGSSTTSFNRDGVLTGFDLVEPQLIGGVECCCAGVQLYAAGKVKSCYVKTTQIVGGVPCTGSISFNQDGTLHRCKTAAAVRFENFEAPEGTWITLYDGTNAVDRFENGDAVLTVDGQPCQGYFNYLHRSGKLRKCELAEGRKIAGKAHAKGSAVCFDEAGKVVECSTMSFVSL